MVKSGYELSKRHRRKIYLPPQPLYRRSSDRQRAGDHPRQKYRQAQGTLNGRRDRLEKSDNPNRKTAYDLIAVKKDDQIINIDSQAPNKIAAEWLPVSGLFEQDSPLRQEVTHKNSRFDLLAGDTWIEVKGITLNEEGIARFPDAPTLRGVKHLNELTEIAQSGGKAMVLFIVQMKGIHAVEPNDKTHPEFGAALRRAAAAGVKIHAVDCIVAPDRVNADRLLPVIL